MTNKEINTKLTAIRAKGSAFRREIEEFNRSLEAEAEKLSESDDGDDVERLMNIEDLIEAFEVIIDALSFEDVQNL